MAQQFTSPLLAPDLQRKQMEFQQNQMLAKALMQQGMQPNEGRMISGHYVRPDAGRAIANAFSLYAGMKGMQDAPQQMADLQKAQQDYNASLFSPQQDQGKMIGQVLAKVVLSVALVPFLITGGVAFARWLDSKAS